MAAARSEGSAHPAPSSTTEYMVNINRNAVPISLLPGARAVQQVRQGRAQAKGGDPQATCSPFLQRKPWVPLSRNSDTTHLSLLRNNKETTIDGEWYRSMAEFTLEPP